MNRKHRPTQIPNQWILVSIRDTTTAREEVTS
jgi:hypothetical protein